MFLCQLATVPDGYAPAPIFLYLANLSLKLQATRSVRTEACSVYNSIEGPSSGCQCKNFAKKTNNSGVPFFSLEALVP